MKFIQKINTFLLHRYPTIWNTKIVWMLSIALLVHLFFFFVGYIFYTNPTSLHSWISDDYFSSGMFFIHVLISLIILVAWVTQLLKNNAFNNFYPMKFPALFGQFLQYIIIIFANISFAFSFYLGNKVYMNRAYNDEKYAHYLDIANKGNVFLPVTIEKYLLDKRILPESHSNLYCETDPLYIDFEKLYFTFCKRFYQFYNVVLSDTLTKEDEDDYYINFRRYPKFRYYEDKDSIRYVYHRKEIENGLEFIKNAKPNFRNFSDLFIYPEYDYEIYNHNEDEYEEYYKVKKKYAVELSRYVDKTLNDNNKAELERLVKQFLQMSKDLAVETDLNETNWLSLIYNPESDFEVQKFIKSNKDYDNYYYDEAEEDAEEKNISEVYKVIQENKNLEDISDCSLFAYRSEHLVNHYYRFDTLKTSLDNIKSLKIKPIIKSVEFFTYLWFSIGLALLLFGYRVFKLKAVLLSGVTAGGIALLSALLVLFVGINGADNDVQFFIYGLAYFLYSVILAITIFLPYNGHKNIKAILMNIALAGFPVFALFILLGISKWQKDSYYQEYGYNYDRPQTFLEQLSTTEANLLILVSSLVFWFIYMKVIMKWKASSE